MKIKSKRRSGEEGFVMVASLLILLVLTMLGIAVNRNTDIEWRIAMNDRVHKETFYAADAATELASEALEQGIACLGFKQNAADTEGGGMMIMGGYPDLERSEHNVAIEGNSLGFWRNYAPAGLAMPTDTERNMVFPAVVNSAGEFDRDETNKRSHANINIGGNTDLTKGAALQLAAGYEGLGKGMGGGGATLTYTINVQQRGRDGSESTICVQYGHVLGSSGNCNY
ncbi:PilX N-terminal domain-containing pilus assembly protein [Candidatus Electronema sp. JC]|uniref:PilX N-terminal domain-containing pilus assembly protein n=1 Tax=Candidatus Electronema sp. JC TaxID=3401570 RepID=UPI003AA8CEF2